MALPLELKHQLLNYRFNYKESKHEQFCRQGYITFNEFLTEEAVAYLRQEYDYTINNKYNGIENEWVLSVHQCLDSQHNWMWQLATQPRLVDMLCRQLETPNVILYSSQLAYKAPRSGKLW